MKLLEIIKCIGSVGKVAKKWSFRASPKTVINNLILTNL